MEDVFLDTSAAAFLFPIPFGSYGVGFSLLVDSLDTSDGWTSGTLGGSAIDETSASSCKHFSFSE